MHRIGGIAALVAAALVLAAPLSATAASPPTPVASMHVDTSFPEVGDTVTVKGVVTHVPRSTTLQIQRHTRSGWHRVGFGSTGGGGAYVATFTASGLGKEPLRAVVAATKHRKAVTSVTRTIGVVDWFPLDEVTALHRTGTVDPRPTAVQGGFDAHVVVFTPTATALRPSATWELDGVCRAFRSNVVWDEKTPGTDTLRVLSDGVQKTTATVSVLTGVATDLHGTRRLTLETDGVAGVAAQRAAWVDADVLCTEDPESL